MHGWHRSGLNFLKPNEITRLAQKGCDSPWHSPCHKGKHRLRLNKAGPEQKLTFEIMKISSKFVLLTLLMGGLISRPAPGTEHSQSLPKGKARFSTPASGKIRGKR